MTDREQSPRFARLAARVLARRAADDAAAAPTELRDRTAAVTAIERALRARGRRRIAPWLGWGVAAAAAALLWIGWRGTHAPSVAPDVKTATVEVPHGSRLAITSVGAGAASIETDAGVRVAATGDRIAAGARVSVSGPGDVLLGLDTGTRLRVAAAARMRVIALGAAQRFDLEAGTLEAEVAKLRIGDRFVVATPDAEVEVKGTRFEVVVRQEPAPCAPFVRTQVIVHEGVVAVRAGAADVRVPAGSVWPACPTPAPSPVRAAHTRPSRAPATPAAVSAAPLPATDPSTLAEQNDLFAAALAARRRGDTVEAIQWLDRLIARYPGGPLTDSARAERRRMAAAGGNAPGE